MKPQRSRNELSQEEVTKFEYFLKKLDLGWKNLNKVELLDTEAELVGKVIGYENRRSQIRGFFDEINAIRAKLEAAKEETNLKFEDLLPAIKLIKAKVAYKSSRKASGGSLVSQRFKNLIFKSIDSIKTKEDFQVFAEFFEAMYAYFYGYARHE